MCHPMAVLECGCKDNMLIPTWGDLHGDDEVVAFREMSECVSRNKGQPCPTKCPTGEPHPPDREERRSKRREPAGAIRKFMEKVQL